MPVLYPPEVCRSDYHTFEVPTERKLFHPRFESSPLPAMFSVYLAKIMINTAPLLIRCLPSTLIKYVNPDSPHL